MKCPLEEFSRPEEKWCFLNPIKSMFLKLPHEYVYAGYSRITLVQLIVFFCAYNLFAVINRIY